MLTFFRRIRKGMLEEGSTRLTGSSGRAYKYLLYAIGEILLVVVGILLALQVNNWNTNKRETKELHSYLISIKNNLDADLIGLEEIRVFRDFSITNSKNYLNLAKKGNISIEEYVKANRSEVFKDSYFKAHNSGFEALKSSGYIGKLNGTVLEEKLNEYYYILEKIYEREAGLNHTTENMENSAFDKNVRQRMLEIVEMEDKEKFFSSGQKEIKELLSHPNMMGAHIRNAVEVQLPQNYRIAEELAKGIILEIDGIIKES